MEENELYNSIRRFLDNKNFVNIEFHNFEKQFLHESNFSWEQDTIGVIVACLIEKYGNDWINMHNDFKRIILEPLIILSRKEKELERGL
tara:strand:+ start:8486 stop:8752 length:267 start_codon:yes stop_codon:yes gene_type:complete